MSSQHIANDYIATTIHEYRKALEAVGQGMGQALLYISTLPRANYDSEELRHARETLTIEQANLAGTRLRLELLALELEA